MKYLFLFLNLYISCSNKFTVETNNKTFETGNYAANNSDGNYETGDAEPIEFTGTIAEHNKYRQEVGVKNVVWSNKVAEIATKYAKSLETQGCPMVHNPNSNGYGENIAAGHQMSGVGAAKMWGAEKNNYNKNTNSCSGMCGHYTQIVWKNTRQIGCAIAKCSSNKSANGWPVVVICNYNPAGNYNGMSPY